MSTSNVSLLTFVKLLATAKLIEGFSDCEHH